MWKDTELAYLAGIIDGEGFFSVRRRNDSNSFAIMVGVVTTDLFLLDWIQERFGGKVYHRPPATGHPTWKLKYEWRISTHELDFLLPAVRPYLLVKARHADVMMELRSTFQPRNYWHVPQDVLEKRLSLVDQITSMNRGRKVRTGIATIHNT